MTSTAYHKINAPYKRHTEGPDKGHFKADVWSWDVFEQLAEVDWVWTEKVDGTNIRLSYSLAEGWTPENGWSTIELGGRTDNAQIPQTLVKSLVHVSNDHDLWDEVFPNLAPGTVVTVHGEGYGPGIQKGGGKYRDDVGFIVFDVVFRGPNYPLPLYLQRSAVEEVAHNLGLPVVPVIDICPISEAECIVSDGLRSYVSTTPDTVEAEGVVGTPVGGLLDRTGKRIITKIKAVDYR